MSLVGTRPPTIDEFKNYSPYHKKRLSFRPGITGLWQVSGRNEISDFDNFMKSLFIYLGYDLSAINNNYPSLISNNPQEAILNSENSIIQNVQKIKNEIETISQVQENSTAQINDNENEKNIGEEKNKEKAKNKTINQAQDSSTNQINNNEKEKNIVEKNNSTRYQGDTGTTCAQMRSRF